MLRIGSENGLILGENLQNTYLLAYIPFELDHSVYLLTSCV